MQESWQRLKIPPPWKPDEWICHHSGNRSSAMRDDYTRYGSNSKSAPATPKRISTAKLRRQIENLSLKSANYRPSSTQSKTKRLTSTQSRKTYKSFFSTITHRPVTPIHIPKMSKKSFKRWLAARDAYLGHNFPYVLDRFEHHHRRRRTKSAKNKNRMIDDESALSILSIETDAHTISGLISSGQQRRLSRKDSCRKRLSQSETNLRRNRSFFDRLKSFVQAPVRSLSRLSLGKAALSSRPKKRVQIIHDHFDDKCVGTETMERRHDRADIPRHDQCIQVNIPRPKIHLHHELDTSMVVGEKKQRIRSARRDVECHDKAIETDLSLELANVEKEKRVSDEENDKTTRRNIKNEQINSHPLPSDVQQEQSQISSMSTKNNQRKKRKNPTDQFTNAGNRVVPLTDLTEPTRHHPDPNGSRTTILTSSDSNLSANEQLQRLRVRFNRLSKERRLLTCLLILFAIIMCGLLIGIFILSYAFQGRTPIIYRDLNSTNSAGNTDGVFPMNDQQTSTTTMIIQTATTKERLARYGESCDNDSGCERPFICQKKSSSAPGMCRCPLKYDFVKDQCVGDLNALCTKDSDCQRFMICSGMSDGTRRCQCQNQYRYDEERRRCRGDYQSPCESNLDCRANLICNKSISPSICSCEMHYEYFPSLQKCRGYPGAVCDRATAECVDNAECRDGACECSNQFVPDENRICVDPCPAQIPNPPRIRYPGNCQRFIDCQQKSKTECPELTLFNLQTQLCDYPKNVFDCQ